MSTAVILYGPPASGKDTVTDALSKLNPRYSRYRRLKVGGGRTSGYRMVSSDDLSALPTSDVIWRNDRYSATYVIDRPELEVMFGSGLTPVVHLGQVEAIAAVRASFPDTAWTTVELWCPRDVASERIKARGTGDDLERLAAWDKTIRLAAGHADLRVDTSKYCPTESARLINDTVEQSHVQF